ncbi:hypothetical protein, partial [Pseudofrankia sp. BMG5.36]|uniref:hypothetical protein n=1 Tax=Pseudofrankia sp. BMG5.36 TaxID=1834512 RepID=UPI000A7934D3
GERPQLCQRRWADAVMSAEEQATAWDKAADDAEKAHQAAVTALDALDRRLGGLRAEAADAERTLRDFDDDVAGLAAHETLRVLVDEGLRGTDEVARAAAAADAAARSADLRAAEQERLAAEASAELTHLDGTGTAPAGADALAVLAALVDAHVGAVTGLEWIEHNVVDADARPAFIAANAELAGGVVVLDAARFDAAASSLATSELVTRTPVTVVTVPQSAAAEAALTPDESRRHVVLPHRATWDRAWARTRRDELETVRSAAAAAAGMARAAASDHRRAAAAGQQFVARWPGADRDELARRSRTAADEVNAAEGQQETLRADRDGHLAQAADARQQRDDARARGVTAHANEQAAQRLMTVCTQADQAAERRPAAERDRQRALRDADDAQEAERSARTRSKAATELAARTRASRDPWLRERAELGVDVAAPDPGGSLEVVRRGWTALRDELHDAERGLVEAGVLERAGRHLGELQARLPRHTPAAIERAEVLAGTIEASSAELRTAAQRQARRDASTAESDQLRAESDQRAAAATERSARPADRPNHVDLANVPEWRPADPANIFAILERLEIRNAELLAAREAAERAETDARELHDLVAADVSALADTSAMWTADKPPTVALFDATKDAARTRMRDLIATLNSAEKAERQARDALRDAVADTRAAVADPRWRDLDAPVAIRLRSLRDGELVTEATALTRKIDIMTRSARGDLDSLDTHRTVIRDGLVSLCRDQRRLLREVSRSSRLPDGLGELSLRPAVKILFDEAPADAAVAKLSQRVDAWAVELATNPKRASSSEVRARWLADAVRDTVIDRPKAGPWTVEILKPRIDGKVLYCPPDRIPHEFSGGQVLTLAVLVYCALSGVRSAHRPGGARPPGTLILDNPFGAASAEALIAMQHRLAAHTGLQLVCATGLNDAGVDAAFTGPGSVIVKLRNDGDLRRNLSFLRLRATVVDGIDIATALTSGRDVDAQRNWVDASAYRIGG